MRAKLTVGFLLFSFCFLSKAAPQLAFSKNSRTFEHFSESLIVKSMAHSCLALFEVPDGLGCNPSFTHFVPKAKMGTEVLLSNGYSQLSKIQNLLDGELNQETIDMLFSDDKVTQIELNSNVYFLSRFLAASYTPTSIRGFAVVRNEANPELEIYAVEESGFTIQSGVPLRFGFSAGARIRSKERKVIKNRVKATVLGTEQGKDALSPKRQSYTFFEPSLSWHKQSWMNFRAVAMYNNLGKIDNEIDGFDEYPELRLGLGISPKFLPWGTIDLTVEFSSLSYEEDFWDKLHFGGLYKFGVMYLSFGIDSNGTSSGIYYKLDQIDAGILYSTTRFPKVNNDYYSQTVYVQIGWQI